MDEEAKAELLTFLVVGQLLAHARSGEWLRTDHLIEVLPDVAGVERGALRLAGAGKNR